MIVLGVDTASDAGGVALRVGNEDVRSVDLGERGRHAEALVDAAAALLSGARIRWDEVGLLAVDVGPGSFTGIRIGISFVLGISEARGIPAVGVGCLDILSRACYDATSPPIGGYIVSVTDVRRGEVMRGKYRVGSEGPSREGEEALVRVQSPGPPPPAGTILAGDGATLLWPEEPGIARWVGTGPARATAAARLGRSALTGGELCPPVPRYARDADARPRRT